MVCLAYFSNPTPTSFEYAIDEDHPEDKSFVQIHTAGYIDKMYGSAYLQHGVVVRTEDYILCTIGVSKHAQPMESKWVTLTWLGAFGVWYVSLFA